MPKTLHRKAEYINRLKNVSMGEILYRIKRAVRVKSFEKYAGQGKSLVQIPEIDLSVLKRLNLPSILNSDGSSFYMQNGPDFSVFEHQTRKVFFSNIQFDDQAPDIRSVWEPARLQSITAQLFSGNKSDAQGTRAVLKDQVLLWVYNNPFLFGVHYLSPMECGLRIPVFFFFLKTLDSKTEQEEKRTILSALYCHSWWISKNLALYSSLGNHTVCECVGLIFGGSVFQKIKQGRKWISRGVGLLEQELDHQILEDGGPAEQSLNYHRFVLDLYWLAVDFLESNNLYDCSRWKGLLHKGERFLDAFSFDRNQFPSIGDSDDGYAVAPRLHPDRQIEDSNKSFNENKLSQKTFQRSGYSVIKSSDGFFMTFDHGPLGMAPLYGHGHADALSITIYKNRKPFLIDPGTYRYNGVSRHRKYFKGTRAHNTVCIDGQDQARQLTGFIWDKPYRSELETAEQYSNRVYFKANHDGYKRLKNPVVHHRELIAHDDVCCLICDSFTGVGIHEFELNFHLDPDVEIGLENEWLVLNNVGESIFLYNPGNCFSIANGQKDPLLGWYSPAYGVLQKTNTLQSTATGTPEDIRFITLICFNETSLNKAIQIREEYLENQCEDILC